MGNSIALEELNGTSQAKPSALPDMWIERLFQRMEDRYGDLWANRYGAFPLERVKRSWADDLGDLSRDELARGVDACRSQLPPTLPEPARCAVILSTSRPRTTRPCSRCMSARAKTHGARLAVPAAVTIDRSTCATAHGRSSRSAGARCRAPNFDSGEWQPVPARAVALPAPKPTERDREAAARVRCRPFRQERRQKGLGADAQGSPRGRRGAVRSASRLVSRSFWDQGRY